MGLERSTGGTDLSGRQTGGGANDTLSGQFGYEPWTELGVAHGRSLHIHGAAYGRILAGIQVPPQDSDDFQVFLDELGYDSLEETNNPAYQIFLS